MRGLVSTPLDVYEFMSARLGNTEPETATPARNPCFQVWVAKRRTHAAKREPVISVWGRESRAFTLNRSASQFRARPSMSRGLSRDLRPLIGSSPSETGFERKLGFGSLSALDDPSLNEANCALSTARWTLSRSKKVPLNRLTVSVITVASLLREPRPDSGGRLGGAPRRPCRGTG